MNNIYLDLSTAHVNRAVENVILARGAAFVAVSSQSHMQTAAQWLKCPSSGETEMQKHYV